MKKEGSQAKVAEGEMGGFAVPNLGFPWLAAARSVPPPLQVLAKNEGGFLRFSFSSPQRPQGKRRRRRRKARASGSVHEELFQVDGGGRRKGQEGFFRPGRKRRGRMKKVT